MTIEPQTCFAPPQVHQITQGGAKLLFRKGAIQTLLERHDFEDGAVRFDLMNLAAQRFRHGGWVAVCSDQIVRIGAGRAPAPIHDGPGHAVDPGFSRVLHNSGDSRRLRHVETQGSKEVTDGRRFPIVRIGEDSVDHYQWRSIGSMRAKFALENRDSHGLEISGGDEPRGCDHLAFGFGAALCGHEIHRI